MKAMDIVALIAAEDRARTLAVKARGAADKIVFALPEKERLRLRQADEGGLPGEMGELYRAADAADAKANALFRRIKRRTPTTLAEVIALLELDRDHATPEITDNVLTCLRTLAEREEGS